MAFLCNFRLVPKRKADKEIHEPLRKISGDKLFLYSGGNSAGLLIKGVADLQLLKTLLAIYQKLQEPSF